MPISIGTCIWNGDVRIPNRRYTKLCIRIRDNWGCVMVCRDTTGRCESGRHVHAGDGGVGVETAQTVVKDDRKPGWHPYTRGVSGVGSSVVPVPVPCCYCCCGAAGATCSRSTRCENGRRCCDLNRRLKGLRNPCGLFPSPRGCQTARVSVDWCSVGNLVDWRMRTRSVRGGRGGRGGS